jgi:hypothetical protein
MSGFLYKISLLIYLYPPKVKEIIRKIRQGINIFLLFLKFIKIIKMRRTGRKRINVAFVSMPSPRINARIA